MHPEPPDEPGVYVFEAWEERDAQAREQFEAQLWGDDSDDALIDPLAVFLDPADKAERSGFGVLDSRYVRQGKSLKKRLADYVQPGKGPVDLKSVTLDGLRGLRSERKVGEWLRYWIHFADVYVAEEETFKEEKGRKPTLNEFYELESVVFGYEQICPRTVTVGWVTEAGVRPNTEDPTKLVRVPLNSGHLRLAIESALLYAGGWSSWGQQHMPLNAAVDVPPPIAEDTDLPF